MLLLQQTLRVKVKLIEGIKSFFLSITSTCGKESRPAVVFLCLPASCRSFTVAVWCRLSCDSEFSRKRKKRNRSTWFCPWQKSVLDIILIRNVVVQVRSSQRRGHEAAVMAHSRHSTVGRRQPVSSCHRLAGPPPPELHSPHSTDLLTWWRPLTLVM